MKYELVYTARAVRDIKSLDENVKKRIGKTIIRYKENPLEYFLFHSTGQDTHGFHLTGMDWMNMIRKNPAYPVNPCSS